MCRSLIMYRYYADAALGSLHRAMAVREWSRLREREVVPLEHALTAFDMFVLHKGNGDFSEVLLQHIRILMAGLMSTDHRSS